MKRTQIAQGVYLTTAPADKFNRARISLQFLFPVKEQTATAHALLPLLMERGYADCPDMTELTKKLARLYGADLTIYARGQGGNRNLCISVTGIKDRFALAGEALCAEYASMVFGVAFRPHFVNDAFDAQAVEIEKKMLRKSLEDEANDKRLYCARQAARAFYKGTLAGVRQGGYLEEVDGLTPQMVTDVYWEMLKTASIECMVLGYGEQTEQVTQMLLAALAPIGRAPVALTEHIITPVQEAEHFTEKFELVQAKLCMGFTTGTPVDFTKLEAYRLAMALFGGSATSRLFLNVREKMNICYYCSSAFQSMTASMFVNSGVEPANAKKAEEAILNELSLLCTGEITDEELEDCRRGLLSAVNSVEDSLGGIEAWYYMQIVRNGGVPIQSPEQARAALLAVTKEDVREVLKQFTLSVSYLVTAKEGEDA